MMLAWAEASFEMMRPPIRTASPVPTWPRVLMLANCGRGGRVEIVGFDQRIAGRRVRALDDGGVGARIERGQDGGFEVVVRLEAGRGDRALLGLAPVVVGENERAGARRAVRGSGSARTSSTPAAASDGPIARRMTCFGVGPLDDEAADQDIVSRADHFAGRNIELARGDDDRSRVVRLGRERNSERLLVGVAIRVAGGSAELRIVDLVERQTRGLEAGEVDLRRDPDAGDERIGISGAGIDPDRDGRNIGAGRGRDAEIIADHVTAAR